MMQDWFPAAKLGIFVHWGIYAVDGVDESWSFFNGHIPYDTYMRQKAQFTAEHYDPAEWAQLFADAGARYAVFTTKHHDGVALWNSDLSSHNVAEETPAKKDLVGPFCEAMRARDIKVGLYFSHCDWSHPHYPTVRHPDWKRGQGKPPYNSPRGRPNPANWDKFLAFHRGQLQELCLRFSPQLLWFDGDWERTSDQWRMKELREQLLTWAPKVVLNSRMGEYGDYETPEQGLPVRKPDGVWEFCMTLNDTWGYQESDSNYKSLRQVIRIFAETIAMGGNMLLNVGPQADGRIPEQEVSVLRGLGTWVTKHESAIYGTQAGIGTEMYAGPSTYHRRNRTINLFVPDIPRDQILVKGLRNNIKDIRLIGAQGSLSYQQLGGAPWKEVPPSLWITVPADQCDPQCSVIQIDIEGDLNCYRGSGADM